MTTTTILHFATVKLFSLFVRFYGHFLRQAEDITVKQLLIAKWHWLYWSALHQGPGSNLCAVSRSRESTSGHLNHNYTIKFTFACPPPRCYPPVIDKIVDNTHKNISVTWKYLSSVTWTMEVYGTFWFVSPLCMITNLCLQIKNQCKGKVFRGNLLRWSFPGLKYQTYLSLFNINKNIFDVFSSSTSGWQGLLSFRIF